MIILEGTLCFCWSCAPTTPGDFLGSSLALKSTRKLRTESSLIPHHHPHPSHVHHLFIYYNRWRLPKRFRKPILFLRKKNNKKKNDSFHPASGWALWPKVTDRPPTLLPDPGTPWIESCNLPHQAARPVHSNLAAGFFPMWIMVQRVKKHSVFPNVLRG